MVEKKVDDDWKKKAEEEKEKLEQDVEKARDAAEHEHDMPPASFEGLVATFALQASMALGEMKHPITGQKKADLPAARYVIDLLAMLQEKTKGNLDHHEELSIQNLITELRFKYVQASGPPAS
jgi:hypothetical protein